MSKPSAKEQLARKQLALFAERLRLHVGSTKPYETVIPHDTAIAMADAISVALDGKYSLDQALGLRRKKGEYDRKDSKYVKLALRMLPLRFGPKPMPFGKIAEMIEPELRALGLKKNIGDTELRAIYERATGCRLRECRTAALQWMNG